MSTTQTPAGNDPGRADLFAVITKQSDALVTVGALIHAYASVAEETIGGSADARVAFSWITAMLVEGVGLAPDEMLARMNERLIVLRLAEEGPT